MENNEIKHNFEVIERKALNILEEYEGSNNFLINLKRKFLTNKNFVPTRSQSDYIITYSDVTPKVAKKWVEIDPYFAKKISDEKLYTSVPKEIWVEKLLVEKDKSYHIWGKVFSGETLHDFWMPKGALIKTHTTEKVTVDYSKYSNRPPLEHQKEAIEKLVGTRRFILADDMGLGKGLVKSTLIYVPNGVKKIGDVVIGDRIIGSDGKPYNVIGVYPQPCQDIYEITFNDGFKIKTDESHLWSVSSPNYGKNRKNERYKKSLVLSTKQMYDGGKITINGDGHNKNKSYNIETYYKSPNGNNKWQIPIVNPIEFENNDILPIDPYLLGLGLGDGYFTKYNNISFVVSDYDYDELFNQYNLKSIKTRDGLMGGKIKIGDIFNVLGLHDKKSFNKFIPDIYKYTSIENRLSILQGLMDTDGHCMYSNNNNFLGTEFSTISKQLCDDIVEIVHTLGGIARIKTRIPTYTHKGVKMKGKLAYRVNIKLPSGMNPFRLKRKADRYKTPKKYPTGRYIKNIEKIGFEESVCISVDSPDKLYVAEHCIVTHNTTSTIIAALETGAKKILIICPASLKINWMREIENYTDRSVFIAENKKFSLDHDFVIVNYDILKNFHELKGKTDSLITQLNPELIIIDEAHYIQNGQAQRTKLVNHFVQKTKYLWLLTGTPMTSRPMNYFNLLNLIESPVAQNWMAYAIRYCQGYQFNAGKRKVWNVSGASNLEELRDRTSRQVLRRLKTDVLDLPDKIITPVYLKLKSKEYEAMMGEYYNWYENKKEESSSLTIQFSKLMKVRQIIAEEKIKTTIELAQNIIDQDKKVIIFTNFTDALQKIYQHFGKEAVYLDGSCSKPHRQNAVDQFQDNEKIKVFVGNLKASGVGITLTAGEACIMNDLSFVPSDHQQAEDRAYRFGQKNSVSIYYPIFENTIEGVIYDILSNKKNIIDTVMGDNLDRSDVVQEIMNRIHIK